MIPGFYVGYEIRVRMNNSIPAYGEKRDLAHWDEELKSNGNLTTLSSYIVDGTANSIRLRQESSWLAVNQIQFLYDRV